MESYSSFFYRSYAAQHMMGMKYVYSQRALHVVVSAFLLSLIMQNNKGAQNIVFLFKFFDFLYSGIITRITRI